MYQQFFGFNKLPFKITPDERVFFAGAHRQEMLDALLYGIERGEGIITVVGEVGIGKTTLARVLSNRFSDCFAIISIFTPNVSASDMLRLIAQEAGLNPALAAGKVELMQLIRGYCMQIHQQGKRFLLLIDEAQTMLVETIEELRLLSNMQVDDVKLVQVLMFGQPELDRMLNSPELRQVKDRVVFQIHIQPFSRDELADYLAFRLQQAGYKGQYFFSDAVVDAIYQKSQGYARAVNRLADQALMAAFAEQTHQVKVDHVTSSNQEAIQPLSMEHSTNLTAKLSNLARNANLWRRMFISLVLFAVAVWVSLEVIQTSQNSIVLTEKNMKSNPTEINMPDVSATQSSQEEIMRESLSKPQVLIGKDTNPGLGNQENVMMSSSMVNPALQTANLDENLGLKTGKTNEEWEAIHYQQLQLFHNWARQEKYTVQLMSSPWRLNELFAKEVSMIMALLPKAPAFYYHYELNKDRPRIAVIYGVYHSKEDAQQAINAIVKINKRYKPEMMSYKQVVLFIRSSQVLASPQ